MQDPNIWNLKSNLYAQTGVQPHQAPFVPLVCSKYIDISPQKIIMRMEPGLAVAEGRSQIIGDRLQAPKSPPVCLMSL